MRFWSRIRHGLSQSRKKMHCDAWREGQCRICGVLHRDCGGISAERNELCAAKWLQQCDSRKDFRVLTTNVFRRHFEKQEEKIGCVLRSGALCLPLVQAKRKPKSATSGLTDSSESSSRPRLPGSACRSGRFLAEIGTTGCAIIRQRPLLVICCHYDFPQQVHQGVVF